MGLCCALISLGLEWLRTTAKVADGTVLLTASGVRTRLPLEEIESVTNSYFPSGGYGYRWGKATAASSAAARRWTSN